MPGIKDLADGPGRPPGGGVEVFDQSAALDINRARLEHLLSLGLPIRGRRILDVGCGVGHFARALSLAGGLVHAIDAREENIRELRRRHPELSTEVADVESGNLAVRGPFDGVLCYGLLYHLENPVRALRNLAAACGGWLAVETVVTDCDLPVVQMAEEPDSANQALRGLGCRPSPSFVAGAARAAGFAHVYRPRSVPDHPDFDFERRNDLAWRRDGNLLRCVFVASRSPLAEGALEPWEDDRAVAG